MRWRANITTIVLIILLLLGANNMTFAVSLTSITLDPEDSSGATTNAPGAWSTNIADPLSQVGVMANGVFLNQGSNSGILGEISIPLLPGINVFNLYGNLTVPGNSFYGAILFFDGVPTPPQIAVYNANGNLGSFQVQPAGTNIMGGANGGSFFDKAPGTSAYIAPDGTKVEILYFVINSVSSKIDKISFNGIGPDGNFDTTAQLILKVTPPADVSLTSVTLDPEDATGATTNAPGAWSTNTADPLSQVGVMANGVFLNQGSESGTLGEISIPLRPGINAFTLYGNGVFPGNDLYGAILFFDDVPTPPQSAVYNANGAYGNFSIQPADTTIIGSANGGLFFDKAPGTSVYIAPDGTKVEVLSYAINSLTSNVDKISFNEVGPDGTMDTTAQLVLRVTPMKCAADFDKDGNVDGVDLSEFAIQFGLDDCPLYQ